MGLEAACTARSGGRKSEGRALLETDALLFRGDFRLKIPLAEIREVEAKGAVLRVRWSEGSASFTLGSAATRWVERIQNPKSLIDKLDVKPGQRIAVLGVDDAEFLEALRARVPEFASGRPRAGNNLIFFAAGRSAALARLAALSRSIVPNGAIWVIWPKGRADINEDRVRDTARRSGLVDIKVVRFSETCGALKLVIPVKSRPKTAKRASGRRSHTRAGRAHPE